MLKPVEGGCACGAIRYEFNEEPAMTFKCHCRDCQRATGTGFVTAIIVRKKAFRFTKGTPKYYAVPSTKGGTNTRSFCGECGSRLTGGERPAPAAFFGITAASLDDPSWVKPQMHFFVSQAQPWDLIEDDLPKYDEYAPPAEPNPKGSTKKP